MTLVGQNLGAGDIPRADAAARQALKSGMIWMCLMGVGFFVWRRELFGLYTQDETVVMLGGMLMTLVMLNLIPVLYSFYGHRDPPEGAGDMGHS